MAKVNNIENEQLPNKVDKVEGKGLSTNDFTNNHKTNLERLETNIKNLGHFDTEENATNYLKTLSICADIKIIHAYLTYGDENNFNSIIMIQNVYGNTTKQILFNKNRVTHRNIYFTNNERTEIRSVDGLQYLFCDRLKWSISSNKYLTSQLGSVFDTTTDPIPIATKTADGLMSKEDKVKLDNIGTLEISTGLIFDSGDNKLTVNYGDGLEVVDNKLKIKKGIYSGFEFSDGCLNISTGAGITVDYYGGVRVLAGDGITTDTGYVSIKQGKGITTEYGTIDVRHDDSLEVNSDNALRIRTGYSSGLAMD